MNIGTALRASARTAAWVLGALICMFSGSVQAMCGQDFPSPWGRDHAPPVSTKCADGVCITSAAPFYSSTHSIDGNLYNWLCDSPEEAVLTSEVKAGQQFPEFCQSLGGNYQGIVQKPSDIYLPVEIDGKLYYPYVGNCGHTRYGDPDYRYTTLLQPQCPWSFNSRSTNLGDRVKVECVANVKPVDIYSPPPSSCQAPGFGKPIYPLTGHEQYRLALTNVAGDVELALTYSSLPLTKRGQRFGPKEDEAPIEGQLGSLWWSSLHRQLLFSQNGPSVQAIRGDGRIVSFNYSGAPRTVASGTDDRLEKWGNVVHYRDQAMRAIEAYTSGRLDRTMFAKGGSSTAAYSDDSTPAEVAPGTGYMLSLTDDFGRSIGFRYKKLAMGKVVLSAIVQPDQQWIVLEYNESSGNLVGIQWPDEMRVSFAYESTAPGLERALTGVYDENDVKYATVAYHQDGWAESTKLGGGVDKFSVRYLSAPMPVLREVVDLPARLMWRYHEWVAPAGTVITTPKGAESVLGTKSLFGLVEGQGATYLTSITQPAGSGCGASSSEQQYDVRGNVVNRLGFGEAGQARLRTCYAYASDRNVETHRVEGMLESDACPADLAAYQVGNLPADKPQRKITTMWHPDWKLEARRAEPNRITTTVYNGQQDPVDSQHPALNCATNAPTLPDGKKIAVVCKRYEQATADDTGNQGLNASVTATRTWSYTYNQYGQIISETDPRGKITTYDYWPDTVFDGVQSHWQGDLKAVNRPLNLRTQYLEYNKRGQPLAIQHPNGSTERRDYHQRGWLRKVTLTPAGGGVGEVTQYEYHDTGLLKKVTNPDGSFAAYTWDPAHRLTDVADSVGNSAHYVLDDSGNRLHEQYKGSQDTVVKTISRTFDALNRLQSVIGMP